MITHPSIFESIEFATRMHAGQFDKAGVPYIVHPLTVMRNVPEEARHVAVLHDLVEDCGVGVNYLETLGYDPEELSALRLLTRPRSIPYETYIDQIAASGNALAIAVKRADLHDNLDSRRDTGEPDVTRTARERKYRIALLRLEGL